MKLNTETLELFTSNTATLTATVQPGNATNQNVTWSSSDGAVATVDANGNVTAVAPGTAAITVTTMTATRPQPAPSPSPNAAPAAPPAAPTSEPSYSPILETEGEGTVKVDPRTPGQGDAVTVTPTPDRGWDVGLRHRHGPERPGRST